MKISFSSSAEYYAINISSIDVKLNWVYSVEKDIVFATAEDVAALTKKEKNGKNGKDGTDVTGGIVEKGQKKQQRFATENKGAPF